MEVIRLPGYTEDEKANIARRYLLPKQVKANGLKEDELKVSDPAILEVDPPLHARGGRAQPRARDVQDLPQVGQGAAARARPQGRSSVTPKNLAKYLGVKRFRYGRAEESDQVGQVTGLAWTEVGGELLTIESAVMPGKGKLTHTGQLGEVMQESIQAAMTVVRSRANVLGLEPEFYQKADVHIHVPEGATPKDGPSAGIGMCTALVSALTKIPVRADVAMTGEITLRGEVLPIGGLKEKLLAAHRGGIRTVLIPDENVKDLAEIPGQHQGQARDQAGQVDRRGPAARACATCRSRRPPWRESRRMPSRVEAPGPAPGQAGARALKRASLDQGVPDVNKNDLIDAVAERTGLAKSDAARAVEAVLGTITEALQRGDAVALSGFGSFVAKARAARTGRNPRTGEPVAIAASRAPAFKAGKALKDALN